jgi:SWI/SNF-related matrix-associated actin-dependent regulator of chromatin subfamily A3
LDTIQSQLQKTGHSFTRIDGTMTREARTEAQARFDTEGTNSAETPRLILCSLKACGVGINLTRANHVFLMDPYWNVATEDQAMDRVHRIGQTRPVKVVRFVMKDSIEERLLNVQSAKAALGKGSMEKLGKEEQNKARLTAMKDLFEVEEADGMEWDCSFINDDDDGDDGDDGDDDDGVGEE